MYRLPQIDSTLHSLLNNAVSDKSQDYADLPAFVTDFATRQNTHESMSTMLSMLSLEQLNNIAKNTKEEQSKKKALIESGLHETIHAALINASKANDMDMLVGIDKAINEICSPEQVENLIFDFMDSATQSTLVERQIFGLKETSIYYKNLIERLGEYKKLKEFNEGLASKVESNPGENTELESTMAKNNELLAKDKQEIKVLLDNFKQVLDASIERVKAKVHSLKYVNVQSDTNYLQKLSKVLDSLRQAKAFLLFNGDIDALMSTNSIRNYVKFADAFNKVKPYIDLEVKDYLTLELDSIDEDEFNLVEYFNELGLVNYFDKKRLLFYAYSDYAAILSNINSLEDAKEFGSTIEKSELEDLKERLNEATINLAKLFLAEGFFDSSMHQYFLELRDYLSAKYSLDIKDLNLETNLELITDEVLIAELGAKAEISDLELATLSLDDEGLSFVDDDMAQTEGYQRLEDKGEVEEDINSIILREASPSSVRVKLLNSYSQVFAYDATKEMFDLILDKVKASKYPSYSLEELDKLSKLAQYAAKNPSLLSNLNVNSFKQLYKENRLKIDWLETELQRINRAVKNLPLDDAVGKVELGVNQDDISNTLSLVQTLPVLIKPLTDYNEEVDFKAGGWLMTANPATQLKYIAKNAKLFFTSKEYRDDIEDLIGYKILSPTRWYNPIAYPMFAITVAFMAAKTAVFSALWLTFKAPTILLKKAFSKNYKLSQVATIQSQKIETGVSREVEMTGAKEKAAATTHISGPLSLDFDVKALDEMLDKKAAAKREETKEHLEEKVKPQPSAIFTPSATNFQSKSDRDSFMKDFEVLGGDMQPMGIEVSSDSRKDNLVKKSDYRVNPKKEGYRFPGTKSKNGRRPPRTS